MNRQQVKGVTNQVTGEVKQQAGKLMGDRSLAARGHAREQRGKVQKDWGDAREATREEERRELERKLIARERRGR